MANTVGEQTLHSWSDFSGGHWGVKGAVAAQRNQWGGQNVAVTRRGGLAPVSASRRYVTDAVGGRVWGMRWAWGLDGYVYFVQQDSGGSAAVRRFDPSDPTTSRTVSTLTGAVAVPYFTPDWTISGGYLYLTIYGTATYKIDPTAATVTELTGGGGDAAAGRTICVYGERMLVGGVSDPRWGTYPSRFVYSAAADYTDWTDTNNFYDVGGDNKQIRALVPMRDACVIVLEDGQLWVATGTPSAGLTLRRYHGFDRGAGAISAFAAQHVAIDPTQTKAWVYDHQMRGVSRFNGASLSRVSDFGAPGSTRTMDGEAQGDIAVIGGPDEVMVARVAAPRVGVEDYPVWHSLLRLNGAWAPITQATLTTEG
jgi:hypothetical protein